MERFYLAVPTGASTVNDRVLVYDTQHQWWSLYDVPAAALASFRSEDAPEVHFGYASPLPQRVGRLTLAATDRPGRGDHVALALGLDRLRLARRSRRSARRSCGGWARRSSRSRRTSTARCAPRSPVCLRRVADRRAVELVAGREPLRSARLREIREPSVGSMSFSYVRGNPDNLVGGSDASMNDIQGPFYDLRDHLNANVVGAAPLVTVLPSSPLNGQECYFSPQAGTMWHLRYNDASASPYKWEVVGGPPLRVFVAGQREHHGRRGHGGGTRDPGQDHGAADGRVHRRARRLDLPRAGHRLGRRRLGGTADRGRLRRHRANLLDLDHAHAVGFGSDRRAAQDAHRRADRRARLPGLGGRQGRQL
jgi:hypothetical protein